MRLLCLSLVQFGLRFCLERLGQSLWILIQRVDAKAKEMGMVKPMIINFIVNLIAAGSIYYLFPQLLVLSFSDLLKTMIIVWFGFAFPVYANQAVWERKSWNLVLLNTAYGILGTIIITSVIYYLQ